MNLDREPADIIQEALVSPRKAGLAIAQLEQIAKARTPRSKSALDYLVNALHNHNMRSSWGHIVRCLWRVEPEAAPIHTILSSFDHLSSGGKRSAAKIMRRVGLPDDLQPRIGEIVRKIWSDAREDDRRPDHYLLSILEEIPFQTA